MVMMFQNLRRVMTSGASTLTIQCQACDHLAVWTRQDAFAKLGGDASPYEVRRRLYCGACGSRADPGLKI